MQNFEHNSVERFLFDNHGVRGEIVKIKKPFEELLHDSYPKVVKSVMMELSVASVLIASTLKDGSEIMIQIRGGKTSPLKYALINIRQDLSFYGSASLNEGFALNDDATLADLCSNDSVLVISVFPKDGKKWQGIVAIDPNSISATLENYFKDSQQLPTRFLIQTDMDNIQSGGIMLQIIPNVDKNIESLDHLAILSGTLTADELFTLSLEESLTRLFSHEEVKVFGQKEIVFRCICSKQRCENALLQLDPSELKKLIDEDNGTTMTCQHCGKTYTFDKEELSELLVQISQ